MKYWQNYSNTFWKRKSKHSGPWDISFLQCHNWVFCRGSTRVFIKNSPAMSRVVAVPANRMATPNTDSYTEKHHRERKQTLK